jgi:raffinose/stachyose/melibiose transport system substrate-binding protein
MRHFRTGRGAVAVCLVLLAASCGNDSDDGDTGTGGDDEGATVGSEDAEVTITWWHNANNDPGLTFWQEVAGEFTAENPHVEIAIEPTQNEELREQLPIALNGPEPPDLFQQWGGGEMRDQVEAGVLMDITDEIDDWIDDVGPVAESWQVDGRQYGVPYTVGVVGFWYNQDLFAEAGIDEPPEAWDDLYDTVDALKDAGIEPIALGGQDRWPAAFFWDYMAVRVCPQDVIELGAAESEFDDPCWVQAGELLQDFIDSEPFNEGFLATPAQQGSSSSAGLMGNGNAAMELQGHWNGDQMRTLAADEGDLDGVVGWFPFPAVPGADGDPTATLGGGDGFSCSAQAPPECVDFLAYLLSPDVQTRWAALDVGPPVMAGSEEGVGDPNLQTIMEFRDDSPFVQLYLDIALGSVVGEAKNEFIADQFAGAASPEDIVDAMRNAAG